MDGAVQQAREPSLMERLRSDLINLRCGANDLNLSLRSMRGRLLQDLTTPPPNGSGQGSTANKIEGSSVSFQDIAEEVQRIAVELREAAEHFAAVRKIG